MKLNRERVISNLNEMDEAAGQGRIRQQWELLMHPPLNPLPAREGYTPLHPSQEGTFHLPLREREE